MPFPIGTGMTACTGTLAARTGNLYLIPFIQFRYMIKVAINGYGTIGKRVADAVAAQKDMKVIGVSKTRPNAEAFIAKQRGYPLYIADVSKKVAFERVGLAVAGSVEDMCKAADVIVDATPGGVGASNKAIYEKLGKKALWQGGEDHRGGRVFVQLFLQLCGCHQPAICPGCVMQHHRPLPDHP